MASDSVTGTKMRTWQDVDRDLHAVAKRRGLVDFDEAALLCEGVRLKVWLGAGCGSFQSYLEKVFGYSPKVARERVRVAEALDEMPEMSKALFDGTLTYSAVRELTRVATVATQKEWLDHARDKSQRDVEAKVSVHHRGDRPTDVPDLSAKPKVLRFVVTPATYARFLEAQKVVGQEHGFVDEDMMILMMSEAILSGSSNVDEGRAKYQVMSTVCEVCERGTQDAAGQSIRVDDSDVARAECDAQRINADMTATQDVAPKVRRFVYRRDHGRCCVPGCRSARFNEVHHIVPRHLGGSHKAENLTLLCDGHHRALHEGKLTITGEAPKLTVTTIVPDHLKSPSPSRRDLVEIIANSKRVVRSAGYLRSVAVDAPRGRPRASMDAA